MKSRDLEYIQNRLAAPAVELLDAIERLRRVGEPAVADRLMEGAQRLTDLCRTESRLLADNQRYAHGGLR